MDDLRKVPVVEIDRHNLCDLWPSVVMAVKSATFIALDLELSGLGDNIKVSISDLQQKYEDLREAAKTRCILSMGVSCYQLLRPSPCTTGSATSCSNNVDESTSCSRRQYLAQTFNIYCCCTESFTMEPGAVSFLLAHGFDFNRQLYAGVPYKRGNDSSDQDTHTAPTAAGVNCSEQPPSIRELFSVLTLANKPLVLHNGLLDLVYMYHNFYAHLPGKCSSFLCDLGQMFPAGIYDTKFIMRTSLCIKASYLEYGFRKSQCDNLERCAQGKRHVALSFLPYPAACSAYVQYSYCSVERVAERARARAQAASPHSNILICQHYAQYGWCKTLESCGKSHDVYEILVAERVEELREAERRRERRLLRERKRAALALCGDGGEKVMRCGGGVVGGDSVGEGVCSAVDSDDVCGDESCPEPSPAATPQQPPQSQGADSHNTNKHTSGFDAFMTGYVMCHFMAQKCKAGSNGTGGTPSFSHTFGTADFKNKVHYKFSGPPIMIVATNFAKPSQLHVDKFKRLTEREKEQSNSVTL